MTHFDDILLHCDVPTIVAKPLTVIKHLVSTTLHDKEKSYYTALSKQAYSYDELLYFSAKVVAFMVKTKKRRAEEKSHKNSEHYTSNHRSPPLTNAPVFLIHELFVISLIN